LHWLPIAAAVVMARAMGWPDIALGIIFGTSVAVLTSVVGSLCLSAPVGPAPARWKRLWPFTLAAALIIFISGFNGLLTWKHGLALAIEGLVILSLWIDSTSEHDWGGSIADARPDMLVPRAAEWMAGITSLTLALGGAWLATHGAMELQHLRGQISPGSVAASLFSLVLASPMVQSGRQLALAGASWIPMTANIGVVLLNLCLLLPVMALYPYAEAIFRAVQFEHRPFLNWASYAPQVTIFPLASWRIDTVVLMIVSVLFLPVSVGKWNLGREEGIVLIIGYCVYVLAVMVAGL
jgi:cation:H+ antiporter